MDLADQTTFVLITSSQGHDHEYNLFLGAFIHIMYTFSRLSAMTSVPEQLT